MDQQPPAPQPADVPAPPAPTPAPAVPPAQVAPPYWQGGAQPTGPAPGVEFAGFGARLVAYLVDGFVLSIVAILLSLVLVPILAGTSDGSDISAVGGAAFFAWILIIIIVTVLYFPFFWQRSGQTPGMKLLSIRVVRDRDGGPLGWGSALLRYIGFAFLNSIIFGLPIGFLWALFDSRRRGWHDIIGGTVVIKA